MPAPALRSRTANPSVRLPALLIAAVFLAGALLYAVAAREMLSDYKAIESEEVARQMEQGMEAVERRLDRLLGTASDWAVWDDTYAFIKERSPAYLALNTRPEAFSAIEVDYLLLIDRTGALVHAQAVDRAVEANRPFPDALRRLAGQGAPFTRLPLAEDRFRGFGFVGDEWVLFGARPILRSDGSGPPRGVVVFGLRVDEAVRRHFAQTVRYDLSFLAATDPGLPAEVRGALGEGPTLMAVPVDDERIAGYAVMRDMDGRPSLVLRGLFPRTVYARGLESRLTLLLTFLGAGLGLALVAATLTARLAAKERERALAEESLWVRNWALDSALSGIALADLRGNLTYVNASLVSMWGYRDARELLGRAAVSVWKHPKQAAQVVEALLAAGRWDGDLEARRGDGTTFPAHLSAALVRDREGSPVGMMASFADISERLRTMAELDTARRRLEFVVANSPAVIYTCRADGDYGATYVSPNIEAQLGYHPEEMTSDSAFWASRIHPDDVQRVFAGMPALFEKGHHVHDYRFRHRDGSWRWMHDELRLMRDAGGTPVEILGSWLDITERKRADEERLALERRLLHAQKLESLGVLAGGIAHDFNNLLMAVLGNLDLALLGLPQDSPQRAFLERSVEAVHRAAGLTKQMLAYAGHSSFLVEDIGLAALVRESAEFLRASIPKNVRLDCRLPDSLPLVVGDASQILQVIMNLITNAAESIGEAPGTVSLSVGAREFTPAELSGSRVETAPAPGRFVWLEVADSGAGMDQETLERLFEPFFTTKFTGRGLGMASVLGIVRSHRGAIFVESAPDRGTTVRVLFPAAGEPAPRPGRPAAPGAPAATGAPRAGTMLVADDEAAVLEVCREMMTMLGWEVLSAGDGRQAVEIFRGHAAEIGCVVLDLSMPGLDGIDTLAELRRIRPDVRAVLTSGYPEQDATARFARAGFDAFVQKPFTLEKLRAALGQAAGA